MLDVTPSLGVARHPGVTWQVVGLFGVTCTPGVERTAVAWARRQIGKPYDQTAVAGFFTRRDGHDPEVWFRREISLAAFEYAGWPLRHFQHVSRSSPRNRMRSPRLLDIPITSGLH